MGKLSSLNFLATCTQSSYLNSSRRNGFFPVSFFPELVNEEQLNLSDTNNNLIMVANGHDADDSPDSAVVC